MTKKGFELVPPLNFAWQQFLVSAMILLPFLAALRSKFPMDAMILGRVIVFGSLNALSIAMVNLGLLHESSGIGAVLVFTQPLMVFGLSVLFLHEKAKTRRLLGVLMGFAGTGVMSFRGAGPILPFSYVSLLLVLGAFVWALAAVYYKKYLEKVDVVVVTALQFAVGFILLFVLSLASEGLVFTLVSEYLGTLLFVSLGSSILGTLIWLYLLTKEDATSLSTYSFIVPIIALIFVWWLLGENVNGRSYLGTGLILGGIYLVQRR